MNFLATDLHVFPFWEFFVVVVGSYKTNTHGSLYVFFSTSTSQIHSSIASIEAIEISVLIQASMHWNQYTILEITTKMHRINRKKYELLAMFIFLLSFNNYILLLLPALLGL